MFEIEGADYDFEFTVLSTVGHVDVSVCWPGRGEASRDCEPGSGAVPPDLTNSTMVAGDPIPGARALTDLAGKPPSKADILGRARPA